MLGWTVLVVRRHVAAVADLTDDEEAELGPLVLNVSPSAARSGRLPEDLRDPVSGAPQHLHVHVHVVPRPDGLAHDEVGPGIFKFLGVAEADRLSEADTNALAANLRAALTGV